MATSEFAGDNLCSREQGMPGAGINRPKAKRANEATRSDHLLFRMNHEIRTAVNSFLGLTELLRESQLNSKQKLHVNLARASAHRLLQSTSEIVDLRRAELGSLRLCTTSFDLHESMRLATELLSILAEKKKIALRLNISDAVPRHVIGDPDRLSQVVITLVRAAIDRMSKGEIWVNLECDPGRVDRMVKFSVADTGPAISTDLLRHILVGPDPEHQAESESDVALVFAKCLVELMGGVMRVEHEAGLGTTFYFDVRVTETQHSTDAAHTQDGRVTPITQRRPLKILVAEDAPDNLLLIRAFLTDDREWEIDSAENGRVAVQKASAKRYDLILMDIDMPEMDGHDATRQIRVLECNNEVTHVPIIALTAHNVAEAATQSMEAGCSAHLVKPVGKSELIQTIQQFVLSR